MELKTAMTANAKPAKFMDIMDGPITIIMGDMAVTIVPIMVMASLGHIMATTDFTIVPTTVMAGFMVEMILI